MISNWLRKNQIMYFDKMHMLGFTSEDETCLKNTQDDLNDWSGSGIIAQED